MYLVAILALALSVTEWAVERTEEDRARYFPSTNQKGYNDEDLCSFIPFTSVCPDDLHLRMRIAGKLFNQVTCIPIC